MKKISIYAILIMTGLFTANTVCAQSLEWGDWWIGGKIGYGHDKADNSTKTNRFYIAPEFGYDLSNNWSFGMGFGYEIMNTKLDGDKYKAKAIVLTNYARYRYLNGNVLTLFVDGGYGVAGGDTDGVQFGLSPGLSVKITDHVKLQANIGYLGYRTGHFNGGNKGFGFNLDSSDLKFGIFYLF